MGKTVRTVARVGAGIATGGMSEVGRAVGGTVARTVGGDTGKIAGAVTSGQVGGMGGGQPSSSMTGTPTLAPKTPLAQVAIDADKADQTLVNAGDEGNSLPEAVKLPDIPMPDQAAVAAQQDEAERKVRLAAATRTNTVATSARGVLGDAPVNRPSLIGNYASQKLLG